MAKIADYKYPRELNPGEAEEWIKILVNDFGGQAESEESFAQAVGHKSASSGTFRRKIADTRKYGIMTPRGTFKATDLGYELANPENNREQHKAYYNMLRNIPLLTDIHDIIRGNIPDEFWRILDEQTSANPKEAREAADDIQDLYEALVEAESELKRERESEEKETHRPADEDPSKGGGSSEPESSLYVKVGNDELRFDEINDINLQLVRQFLGSKMENHANDNLEQTRLNK